MLSRMTMPAAVAWEEEEGRVTDPAPDDGVARRAEWRIDGDLLHVGQSGHLVKTAAADDSEHALRHG